MSNRILVCCLTISIAMAACAEDKQVIPDPVFAVPGSLGKTVIRWADISCCQRGEKCDVGREPWQGAKKTGEACSTVASAYAAADDRTRAWEYRLRACDLGHPEPSLADMYDEDYGYKSHRGEDDPIGDRQRDAENGMIACCQNPNLRTVDGTSKSKEFCNSIATSFSLAKRTPPRKLVLKELCNKEFVWSACREVKEFQGKPFTEEMYRQRMNAQREAERMVAAARASVQPTYVQRYDYEEQLPQEQYSPVEEEPDPGPIESSPSWGDAAVQAINAARGQDPVQAELNRQLARINAASRQDPPARVRPSAPARTINFGPPPAAAPIPSRVPQPRVTVPYTPPAAPVPAYNYPSFSNVNPPLGATSEPTKVSVPEQRKSPKRVYEPGAQFDSCISLFYDPTKYNWYSIRNSCSEDLRWVMINPRGSGIVSSGGTDCTGESRSQAEQHPDRRFAFCRKGFIPVDAQDRYWQGGQYRCVDSR